MHRPRQSSSGLNLLLSTQSVVRSKYPTYRLAPRSVFTRITVGLNPLPLREVLELIRSQYGRQQRQEYHRGCTQACVHVRRAGVDLDEVVVKLEPGLLPLEVHAECFHTLRHRVNMLTLSPPSSIEITRM